MCLSRMHTVHLYVACVQPQSPPPCMQQALMSDTAQVIACLFQCRNKKKKSATQNTPVVLETVPNYPAGIVSTTQRKSTSTGGTGHSKSATHQ